MRIRNHRRDARRNARVIITYRLARHYGFVTEDEGQVLAWQDQGTCP
jgi:hypothetical protein